MANRSVVVDLIVRTNQFTTGMRNASRSMASETTNMETKVKALQMQVGLLGIGMVAFAAVAIKKWADFDQAMARVEATGGEAAARIDELNEAAKSDEVIALGYDAVQASDAIYELAKAGVSATDIIGGAMTGAMSLAAAETMDAAEAASIMASALNQFNLKGDKSAHVADLLVAGAGKAQGSAHDLGFALKQSGLVADQFGLSIEETTGTLAFFASAGLIGSDAGTSLRTMLLHLAGPSTKAAKLMKEIGLEVYGSNGQMVDMETLADNLQTSMGKLTEKQRNQALATIFGADATRAAALLYREGGDEVVRWTEKVNDAGYAQDVARERMDNLNGDIKKLSATWDRSLINMGESADAPMRGLVTNITEVIDWFGQLSPAIQGVILALTGGGGLVILATLGIAQIVGALTTLKAALIATGVISEATASKMARVFGVATKSLGLLALAATVAFGAFQVFRGMANATKISVDDLAASYDVAAGKFNSSANTLASNKIVESFGWTKELQTGFGSIADAAKYLKVDLNDLSKAMIGNEEAAKRVAATTDVFALSDKDMALQGEKVKLLESTADAMEISGVKGHDAAILLNEAIGKNGEVTDEAIQKAKDLAEAQGEGGNSSEALTGQVDALGQGLDELGQSTATVTAEEVAAAKAHEEYVASVVDSFTSFFGLNDIYQSVIDQQKALAESAAQESDSVEDSWQDFYDGVTVTFDAYIAELQAQVEAQETWAANMLALTDRVKTEMPADLQVAAQEMITELRNLGPEGAAQVAMLQTLTAPQLQQVVDLFRRQGQATGEEWAAGVEAAESPEVQVETESAKQGFDELQKRVDALAGRHVVIPVDLDTSAAMSKWSALQLQLARGRVLTSAPVPHATGGAIAGPGTGTSDSVPALLSNGEHVLTASDVEKAGGQQAIYRLRAGIQSGMMRFAGGGDVSVNGHSLDYWKSAQIDQGDMIRLQIQIRDLQAELGKKGKAALKGLERQQAQFDLGEAVRKLDEGHYANSLNVDALIAAEDARREAEEAARKNAEKQASERANYAKDIGRGDFLEGASESQSGAFSAIDRIRDNVLPVLAGPAAGALAAALNAAEAAASGLFNQMEGVDKTLEEATDQAKELQSISESVQSNLVKGFSLDEIVQTATVNPFTGEVTGGGAGSAGQGMLRSAQAYAAKVKTFASKLQALADKGYVGVILQEVAALGVEAGIPAADALLSLDTADAGALNQAYRDIANFGGTAGQAVTAGFYAGGLAAADGLVAGIQARKDQVQAAIMDMALGMQNALKAALGIASPSRKFRALMQFVGQGVALGLDDQRGVVADASARLFSGVTVPGNGSIYSADRSGSGSSGDVTAYLSDEQVNRLAVAFETGNVRNINAAQAQKNRQMVLAYGARGR